MPATETTAIDSVTLPRRAPAAPKAAFPLLVVLAPLAGAAVLVAVTRSPLMIVFAALSPLIAVASAVDARIAARRRRRAHEREHDAATARFLHDVAIAHDRERSLLTSEHPGAHAVMTRPEHRARRWAAPPEHFAPVRLGAGPVPSTLIVSGAADTDDDRALLAAARVVVGAPVLLDPSGGIGIVASPIVGRALARGLVAQLADAHPPGMLAIDAPEGAAYEWLDDYPHAARAGEDGLQLRLLDAHGDAIDRADAGGTASSAGAAVEPAATNGVPHGRRAQTALVALAPDVDGLPTGCRAVLEVDASGSVTLLTAPTGSGALQAELITARSAARFGEELDAAARTRGVGGGRCLPQTVALAQLIDPPDEAGPRTTSALPAAIGATVDGRLVLDLVASGPHAIVTGTTGSGKSELLISWVLAMASLSGPERVNFLLVDFKGGTAFARLAGLPHTVGVVTDLAHGEAGRALKSLRAELRRREAALADLGIADVRDCAEAPPRLVIVVDEAAAMLSAFPELAGLFSDLAARGRALGVHLVLGTQRATGVFSDALLANCALRLSLRLTSASDSTAVLGTDAAARLPFSAPGRLVVARDGEIVTAQAATSCDGDVAAVAARYPSASVVRSPWLPALPARVPLGAFGAVQPGSIVLGVLDDPDRQLQEGIVYRPQAAHLLVLGVRGSGKTGVLSCIAAQWDGDLLRVPADIEGAWDVLEHAQSRLHLGGGRTCLVLLDDLDALLARFADEHREEVLERVRTLLVDGPRADIAVVCTATALPSGLRSVATHFGERLILRQPDRQEHVLVGAPPELYEPSAPPGRGVWHGKLAHVASVDVDDTVDARHQEVRSCPSSAPSAGIDAVEPLVLAPGLTTIVVARAPAAAARRLRASASAPVVVDVADAIDDTYASPSGGTATSELTVRSGSAPIAVVGDPDAWQSRWQLLSRLRRESPIAFDGCTLAQVRAILHSRVLPPATLPGHALLCEPDGSFRRVALPA